MTLEKQTQDSSSFTVGYREWLEESGTKNVSSSTKDIRASSTPIISNTEKEDETYLAMASKTTSLYSNAKKKKRKKRRTK